ADSRIRCIMSACSGPKSRPIGMLSTRNTPAPMMPASRPVVAPSPASMGALWFCWSSQAASTPPAITHRQQQRFPALMNGSAESTPMNRPPRSAGCSFEARMPQKHTGKRGPEGIGGDRVNRMASENTTPEIAALLKEDRSFPPPPEFAAAANVKDPAVYDRAAADPEKFWAE